MKTAQANTYGERPHNPQQTSTPPPQYHQPSIFHKSPIAESTWIFYTRLCPLQSHVSLQQGAPAWLCTCDVCCTRANGRPPAAAAIIGLLLTLPPPHKQPKYSRLRYNCHPKPNLNSSITNNMHKLFCKDPPMEMRPLKKRRLRRRCNWSALKMTIPHENNGIISAARAHRP